MELTRAVLSEDPYADGNRQKQDEGVSLERAGPRRPYSTTAPHGGTIFSLWRDFSLPSDTELYRPRFCMRGLVFSAVEVARERPNRMLGAAETRVCLFVYTHAANCLLFDDPALPPRQKRQAEASRYVMRNADPFRPGRNLRSHRSGKGRERVPLEDRGKRDDRRGVAVIAGS